MPSSSTARPGIASIASRVAAIAASVSPSSSSPWTLGLAPGRVERAGEQAAGAGRFDQADAAVDDRRVDPAAAAEVQHRRLGQAADDLVGRGDDEVGAAGERVGGQVGVEVQVRAPGLVDDERHAARVGDLGEGGDVGAGAEVGRRDDHRRRPRPGVASSAAASESGVRPWAMPSSGSSSGATKVGRMPLRTSPSITEEWTLRWTTTRSPPWASAMQVAWLPCEAPLIRNQVRARPPGLGGQQLRLLEGRRFGADVDALGDRGDVVAQPDLADQLAQRRVGAGAALVAGDLEAAGSRAE